MKKIDSSLQQLRVFRTKLKHELAHSLNQTKTSKYLVEDEVLDLDGVDFGDETAVREKLTELFHSQLAAKNANAELLASVQLLQSKLAREQEKGRLHPKVTSVVPTSLEVDRRRLILGKHASAVPISKESRKGAQEIHGASLGKRKAGPGSKGGGLGTQ